MRPSPLPLLLALVTFGLSSPLCAGTAVRRAADFTTTVPITSIQAVELDRPLWEILNLIAMRATNPPSPGDLAELKKHPPFLGLPHDQAVIDDFRAIPIAVVDSIEVLRQTEGPLFGSGLGGLVQLINNRRFSLAFGGLPGMDLEVRDDGSSRSGSAAVNLYWVPQPLPGQDQIYLFDPDGFHLCHSLANVGHYLAQPGYDGKPPQTPAEYATWALSQQNRSLAVSSGSLERLNEMTEISRGIAADLTLPSGGRGVAPRIGRQLLNAPFLSDGEKRQKARDLTAFIDGELLPRAQLNWDARQYYRQTLELTLANRLPSLNGYNEPFQKAGFFVETIRKPGTGYPYTSYLGGYASVTNVDTTPTLSFDNRFWRISGKSDGTRESETFTVGELGGISFGGFDGTRLIIGGPSADFGQFRCYGYLDTDGDGRVEAETQRELFTSDWFLGGAHLAWNPATGSGVILDRATRNLYQFEGAAADGFPTGVIPAGSLGNDRTDLWRLNLSYDGQWALGFPGFGGTLSRYDQHTESYLDSTSGRYLPLRLAYTFEETRLNAAAERPILAADQPIRFSGSPDTDYRAYVLENGEWLEKGSATTDPYGNGFFYIPGTDITLKVGGRIRFSQSDGSEASPDYPVTSEPAEPQFDLFRRPRRDQFQFPFIYLPETRVALERGTSLYQFEAVDSVITSPLGWGWFKDRLPDSPANFYLWRLRAELDPPSGAPDYYYLSPGVRHTLYPAWNDLLRRGTTFQLDPAEGAAASLMLLITMHQHTSAFRGTVATFSNLQLTYRLYQNAVFLGAYQMVIIPDLKRLFNPPIQVGPDGQFFVPLRCLVIGGKHYPMMQFRLAYPDNCADAHWHGPRVYHVEGDTEGILDPNPISCGFGSYEQVPQEDIQVPFGLWLLYREYFMGHEGAGPHAASPSAPPGKDRSL